MRRQGVVGSSRCCLYYRFQPQNEAFVFWPSHRPQPMMPTATTAAAPPISRFKKRSMGTWPKIKPVRIRAISMDVTGTLVSFRGSLSQHYLGSAAKCGIDLPKDLTIGPAFNRAYKEISSSTFCFVVAVSCGPKSILREGVGRPLCFITCYTILTGDSLSIYTCIIHRISMLRTLRNYREGVVETLCLAIV
jgi:hypothetical protein